MTDKPLSKEFFDSLSKRRQDSNYNAMMRIHDSAKLYHDRIRLLSENDGIPSGYRMLIFNLSRMPPGITQLELVRATHLKPPTVSVTLQKMERDGYVIRKNNENDLRETLVFLTDKGKALNDKFKKLHDDCDGIALRGLSDEESTLLSGLLNRVIDNLLSEL